MPHFWHWSVQWNGRITSNMWVPTFSPLRLLPCPGLCPAPPTLHKTSCSSPCLHHLDVWNWGLRILAKEESPQVCAQVLLPSCHAQMLKKVLGERGERIGEERESVRDTVWLFLSLEVAATNFSQGGLCLQRPPLSGAPSWTSCHLPPVPHPSSYHRALSWATCAIKQVPTSYLFHTW